MRELPPMNALIAFEAVARRNSVRAAAEELFVTAGAISRHLRSLEAYFSMPLFARVGRGLVLTNQGAAYFERVRYHLDGIRRAGTTMRHESGRTSLKLRSYTTFATRWLIARLSQFQLAEPDIEVKLSMVSCWDELGDFDAAIRLGDGDWRDLDAYPLVPNILTPVCNPAVAANIQTAEDLQQQTLFTVPVREDDWNLWCREAKIRLNKPMVLRSFESSALAYEAAIEGQGVALAQRILVEDDLRAGRLVAPLSQQIDRGRHTYYLVSDPAGPNRDAVARLWAWFETAGGVVGSRLTEIAPSVAQSGPT
jgi:LysR family transcriptional regulator, glycine cleavage system transcriptional activator